MDADLAKRLDRAAAKIRSGTDERDHLILEAHAQGASLREIASHAGMTHVGVKKVIGRHQHG